MSNNCLRNYNNVNLFIKLNKFNQQKDTIYQRKGPKKKNKTPSTPDKKYSQTYRAKNALKLVQFNVEFCKTFWIRKITCLANRIFCFNSVLIHKDYRRSSQSFEPFLIQTYNKYCVYFWYYVFKYDITYIKRQLGVKYIQDWVRLIYKRMLFE